MRSMLAIIVCCHVVAPLSAQTTADDSMSVQLYPVADLVVSFDSQATEMDALLAAADSVAANEVRATLSAKHTESEVAAGLKSLKEMIESVVAPESWHEGGGTGRISLHPGTRTLVIRQAQQTHEEIADLLAALRHEASIRIDVRAEIYATTALIAEPNPQTGDESTVGNQPNAIPHGLLKNEELAALRKRLAASGGPEIVETFSLRNGQNGGVMYLSCLAVMSADRRDVHLRISRGPALEFLTSCELTIRDGQTAAGTLFHSSDGEDSGIFVLVTGQIVIPEEEEELRGVASSSAR